MTEMTEAGLSANVRMIRSDNLPVNVTFRRPDGYPIAAFIQELNDLIDGMLSAGWRTKEASLRPDEDIQEANAYVMGWTKTGSRVCNLMKTGLKQRTGYVYEENFDQLPFDIDPNAPAIGMRGINPELPRDDGLVVHLPGTFQFIRRTKEANNGGMAAKRWAGVYYVPASFQKSETDPHEEALATLAKVCKEIFGETDAEEAGRYITRKYTLAAIGNQETGVTEAHEDPTRLTAKQIAAVVGRLVQTPDKYKTDWERNKLGWLSRDKESA